ncbi:hypothetical protein [Roseateles sp. P5_E1]
MITSRKPGSRAVAVESSGPIRLVKAVGEAHQYSAVMLFPIETRCDSGVAHVLEHVLSVSPDSRGRSMRALGSDFPDLSLNALTECDRLVFYATCVTEASLHAAVDWLVSLPQVPITQEFVEQECFRLVARERSDGPMASGVVYNEMKSTFYTERRQIGLATSEQVANGSHGHEPGGDPELLRHVTVEHVRAFAAEFVTHDNACLLIQADDAALAGVDRLIAALPKRPLGPRPPAAARRTRRDPGTHLFPGNEGLHYHRYSWQLGNALDAKAACLAWAVDGALKAFAPVFAQVAERLGGEYLPDLSGVARVGADQTLWLTFKSTCVGVDHRPLLRPVMQKYLVDYLATTPMRSELAAGELNVREHYLAFERSTPAGLLMLCDYLLYADLPKFNRLLDELALARQALSDPVALAAEASAALACEIGNVVVAPARRPFADVAARERRVVERLSRRATAWNRGPSSRPDTRAPTPRRAAQSRSAPPERAHAKLTTHGVAYLHRVFNISTADVELLPLLLLAFQVIENAAQTPPQVSLQCSPFSQWSGPDATGLFLSIRMKWLRSPVPEPWELDPEALLTDTLEKIARHVALTQTHVLRLRAAICENALGVLLAQAGSHLSEAARITALWSGFPQVELLSSHATHTDIAGLSSGVSRLLAQILASPSVSFLLGDGTDGPETLHRLRVETAQPRWRVRRTLTKAPVRQCNEAAAVAGAPGMPSVIVKYPTDALGSEELAALCLMAEALDATCMTPVFRDDLGAYGSFFGRDATVNQLFFGVYQAPSIDRCVEQLSRFGEAAAGLDLSLLDHQTLRIKALMRFGLGESALNRLVLEAYDLCLGRSERELAIAAQIRLMPLERAQAIAAVFFASATPVISLACDSPDKVPSTLAGRSVNALALMPS